MISRWDASRNGSVRGAVAARLVTLVLIVTGVALAAPTGAAAQYAKGPDPTEALLLATGPFATASVAVPTPVTGFGGGVVHYPTDTSQGTYGAVVFAPGFLANSSHYSWLTQRIASHGFVVLAINTNGSLDNAASRGQQLLAARTWLLNSSSVTDRLDPSRIAVAGHSMGGGGSLEAANVLAGLRAVVPMQPFNSSWTNWNGITAPTLIIGSDGDTTAAVATHAIPFFQSIPGTTQKAYIELRNALHREPVNVAFDGAENPIHAMYTVVWLKRHVDDDLRYQQFLCPNPGTSAAIRDFRIDCPALVVCGDGVVGGSEACDDGATLAGDGCSDTCALETGWSCAGAPSACAPVCGDGLLAGDEACDDDGLDAGDGCSASCTVESGYGCTGAPSACATVCGDGIVAGGESCDDSDVDAGDGCSATCSVESGWTCAGATCSAICGDGVTLGSETCDDGGANGAATSCCSATCAFKPSGTACDDATACTVAACDGANVCVSTPVECDGGATPKTFPPPARTTWLPTGCRTPDPAGATYASRAAWRSLHADEGNTDEVSIAYAPMFEADWVAEPDTWNPTGPVFDDAGNLYFAPFNPREDVVLISLEPGTGARRWAIPNTTGAPVGSGSPLVLDDPDHTGAQIVYLGLYDRVLAVRTDGTVVWDQPTGLPGPATGVFGVNYHAHADAIIGLSRDGWLYAVDRRTGLSVLPAPFQLPGEPAPLGPPATTPPAVVACAQQLFEQFVEPSNVTLAQIIAVLGGNGSEVANYFSIDAATGRLWIGATAPDAEDGATDGVSALGALYRLELVPAGATYTVAETCHASFAGGTASTPALPRDGSRVYVGDNVGNLLAIDPSCQQVWSMPLGEQIRGSIGVAADNHEVYASTASTIHQVIDEGATARISWSAALDVFDLQSGLVSGNANIAGIGANGVAFQAGAGYQFSTTLFTNTGLGLLDRADGSVRWFAQGLDETVAVMSTGPDGALYIGNSPIRRLYASCLSDLGIIPVQVAPALGGIRKYQPIRHELFFRDVVCAGADRVKNAKRDKKLCPASLAADETQLGELYAQARATFTAVGAGLDDKNRLRLGKLLDRMEKKRLVGRPPWKSFQALCKKTEKALL